MKTPDVTVHVTPHEGFTLMECSECGPVAVTTSEPKGAAVAHLALVHHIHITFPIP